MTFITSLFNWIKDNLLIALAGLAAVWFFFFKKKRRGSGRGRSRRFKMRRRFSRRRY